MEQVAGNRTKLVRPTQSFVAALSWLRAHPTLTALEVAWRWTFGIPFLLLCWHYGGQIFVHTPWQATGIADLSINRMLTDPIGGSEVVAQALLLLGPPMLHTARWLAPLLLLGWILISAAGRFLVLRHATDTRHHRLGTLLALHTLRIVPLAGTALLWWFTLSAVAHRTILLPIEEGGEPQMMLYIGATIVLTLALFVLWAALGWIFSIAPVLAVVRNLGAAQSLWAACHLGRIRGGLIEINLVMGVVKIALLILLLVFSATPLPFQGTVSDVFLLWWTVGVGILYCVTSDFFHIARIVGYLHLLEGES